MTKFITVASPKGGAGKSYLVQEYGGLTGYPCIDFDPYTGALSTRFGVHPSEARSRRLYRALSGKGSQPKMLKLSNRPPLLPSHPDMLELRATMSPSDLVEKVRGWNLGDWAIVDTPGSDSIFYQAGILLADIVLCPFIPSPVDVDQAISLVHKMEGLGKIVILIPNMGTDSKADKETIDYVRTHTSGLGDDYQFVHVMDSMIPFELKVMRRKITTPILSGDFSKDYEKYAAALVKIVSTVKGFQ